MRSSSSASSLRAIALCSGLLAFSLLAGTLVVTVLLVASAPLVAIFPPESGAQEIVLGIALMWGVVAGCAAGVFTIGPDCRTPTKTRIEPCEPEGVSFETVARPTGRRHRAANDRRAAVRKDEPIAYADDDVLLLGKEAELPRRGAGRRSRRA